MDTKRLARKTSDRMIAGVCSGLADYLAIDVTLVRLFFVLLALGDGIGVFLYILLWIIMPPGRPSRTKEQAWEAAGTMAGEVHRAGRSVRDHVAHPDARTRLLIGLVLVVLGFLYLLENLDIAGLAWLSFDMLWPILLIIGGIVFLIRQGRNP